MFAPKLVVNFGHRKSIEIRICYFLMPNTSTNIFKLEGFSLQQKFSVQNAFESNNLSALTWGSEGFKKSIH